MTNTPDDDDIEYLELERQEKEQERDGAPLNGRHYKELTAEIEKLKVDVERRRAALRSPT